ncbi:hypothetical protein Nmel_008075, partial [Mimus melanotis]
AFRWIHLTFVTELWKKYLGLGVNSPIANLMAFTSRLDGI